MKPVTITFPKLIGLFLILAGIAVVPVSGQQATIDLETLNWLSPKAVETIDVTIDSSLLQLAAKFISRREPEAAALRELVAGLKGIYIKSFEFGRAGEYTDADLDAIRSQLTAPGWARVVGVRSRRNDNVEVYTLLDGGNIAGVTMLIFEPRELMVINIVGPIDPEKINLLEGHWGIPRLGLHIKCRANC